MKYIDIFLFSVGIFLKVGSSARAFEPSARLQLTEGKHGTYVIHRRFARGPSQPHTSHSYFLSFLGTTLFVLCHCNNLWAFGQPKSARCILVMRKTLGWTALKTWRSWGWGRHWHNLCSVWEEMLPIGKKSWYAPLKFLKFSAKKLIVWLTGAFWGLFVIFWIFPSL